MRPLKIKWGTLGKLISKTFADSEKDLPTKFYFEDEDKILVFLSARNLIFYSEIAKSSINEREFKMEFLTGKCEELLENPLRDKQITVNA